MGAGIENRESKIEDRRWRGGFVPSKNGARGVGKMAMAKRWRVFGERAVASFEFCVILRGVGAVVEVLRGLRQRMGVTASGRLGVCAAGAKKSFR